MCQSCGVPDNDEFSDATISSIDSASSTGYEDMVPGADVEQIQPAKCLFCETTFDEPKQMFAHAGEKHSFVWRDAAKGLWSERWEVMWGLTRG